MKGNFFYKFFPLSKILAEPQIDYKDWAIEILTNSIEEYFNELDDDREDFFTVEELEDKDFTKGSIELMDDTRKNYIKKLSFEDIHAISWK